jgi:hypothetical protein
MAKWYRRSMSPWSQGPDSAVVDDQHGDPMRPGDHSRVTGGRFLLPVLVAPRLSTASPAEVDRPLPTPRRDRSPQRATEADERNEGAGLSAVIRRQHGTDDLLCNGNGGATLVDKCRTMENGERPRVPLGHERRAPLRRRMAQRLATSKTGGSST